MTNKEIVVTKISGKIIRAERDLLEEKYFQLEEENKALKTIADNRGHCIDWMLEHHPEVIIEYTSRK